MPACQSASPAATPAMAAAGMVVTEIATPTAAPARLSNASTPATPAARATPIVPTPTLAKDAMKPLARSTLGRIPRKSRNSTTPKAASVARPRPRISVVAPRRTRLQRPATMPDARRDERHEVRAHGHRADDEDGVVDDDPVAGDDAGDEHEPEVAGDDPRLHASRAQDVRPHQDRCGRHPSAGRLDPHSPREPDFVRGDAERLQALQDLLGGAGVDFGHDLNRPVGRCGQHRRVADAIQPVEQADGVALLLRRDVRMQVEHQRRTVSGRKR